MRLALGLAVTAAGLAAAAVGTPETDAVAVGLLSLGLVVLIGDR